MGAVVVGVFNYSVGMRAFCLEVNSCCVFFQFCFFKDILIQSLD